jgi:ATP-dependent Clp protease ATP-binding subunit ClpC
LKSNTFQFIATTEPKNYAKILEKEGSLARLFHKVEVPSATVEETLDILKIRAIDTQIKQKISTSFKALSYIATKSKQFIHDRQMPDSALNLFNECKTEVKDKIITTKTVKAVLSRQTNAPLTDLDQSQKDVLLNLEPVIHQRMISQEQAVKSVADTLRRAATSLREENRPTRKRLMGKRCGLKRKQN